MLELYDAQLTQLSKPVVVLTAPQIPQQLTLWMNETTHTEAKHTRVGQFGKYIVDWLLGS